ncbi:hypothetical protein E1B28_002828 [Marasmius oreades]|uniref:Uncharacterized protein n=1 Tax=Marasmius oreades TaxID=181124 RepID=A0A9P7RNT4_9AGAR|nr:uncharacterized protein E1B28_002828 [Marasmius oreades]KAG7086910.1 hypothetical protein E1B28_002828 [Marasmius oreades]
MLLKATIQCHLGDKVPHSIEDLRERFDSDLPRLFLFTALTRFSDGFPGTKHFQLANLHYWSSDPKGRSVTTENEHIALRSLLMFLESRHPWTLECSARTTSCEVFKRLNGSILICMTDEMPVIERMVTLRSHCLFCLFPGIALPYQPPTNHCRKWRSYGSVCFVFLW